jgi:hypothetical protein
LVYQDYLDTVLFEDYNHKAHKYHSSKASLILRNAYDQQANNAKHHLIVDTYFEDNLQRGTKYEQDYHCVLID